MLHGIALRQHVVEFKVGVGVVTDGAIDATSTTGPWTWVVPNGVAMLQELAGIAAGGGGGGGFGSTNNRGGGGAGGSGTSIRLKDIPVIPGSSLTITAGAKGTAGAIGAGGGVGGALVITGLVRPITGGTITLAGGRNGSGSTGTAGAGGGQGGNFASTGGTGGAAGTVGGNSGTQTLQVDLYGLSCLGGSGGGGANATGSVAGANAGNSAGVNSAHTTTILAGGNSNTLVPSGTWFGRGTTDGTISYGGGGIGGFVPDFGAPGPGGDGNTTPAAPIGYGSGGGGGGGGAAGQVAGDSYCRFVYWSAD